MLSDMTGALLALVALGNLNMGAVPASAGPAGSTITVEICGEPGHHVIALDGKVPATPRRDCVSACHALCSRRKSIAAAE